MVIIIVLLALILIVSIFILVAYFKVKRKVQGYSQTLFGTTSLQEIMRQAKINDEIEPKSLASLENMVLPTFFEDFPNVEINEFKKMAENSIITFLQNIENKKNDELKNSSDKVKNIIESKIEDTKNDTISYDSIKFHKTVLNSYKKTTGVCRVEFQTALEYSFRKNNELAKKIQDRFRTEYIYIIDENNCSNNLAGVALNCPNCGAPIKNLGQKSCNYCGTGVIDLVKKTWILNDIQQF